MSDKPCQWTESSWVKCGRCCQRWRRRNLRLQAVPHVGASNRKQQSLLTNVFAWGIVLILSRDSAVVKLAGCSRGGSETLRHVAGARRLCRGRASGGVRQRSEPARAADQVRFEPRLLRSQPYHRNAGSAGSHRVWNRRLSAAGASAAAENPARICVVVSWLNFSFHFILRRLSPAGNRQLNPRDPLPAVS